MNWYMAKIVFRIVCGEGDHTPQFDEQLRLINAIDEKEAFIKARSLGENEQDMFFNQKRKVVQWQFINVSELYKLSELADGAELYSRVQEADHAGLYIESVNRKAEHIESNIRHRLVEVL